MEVLRWTDLDMMTGNRFGLRLYRLSRRWLSTAEGSVEDMLAMCSTEALAVGRTEGHSGGAEGRGEGGVDQEREGSGKAWLIYAGTQMQKSNPNPRNPRSSKLIRLLVRGHERHLITVASRKDEHVSTLLVRRRWSPLAQNSNGEWNNV